MQSPVVRSPSLGWGCHGAALGLGVQERRGGRQSSVQTRTPQKATLPSLVSPTLPPARQGASGQPGPQPCPHLTDERSVLCGRRKKERGQVTEPASG